MNFDSINYLLFENRKPLNHELLDGFSGFFTAKMFSFYEDGKYCPLINETLNTYGHIFSNKEDQFKFYEAIIPKLPRKKIKYIKKGKKEQEEKLPIPEFYSKREIDMFEDMNKYPHE